ncbi:YcjF family protein [Beggiatoa leptomitoformis]|nr:DUF697 domain-containing protein [Beggiatoa leptomitoformis]
MTSTATQEEVIVAPSTVLEKTEQANLLVRNYALGSAVVGIVPLPLVDIAGITAVQLKMLHGLAGIYEVEFTQEIARSAVSSLLGGLTSVYLAPSIALSVAKFIPIVGQGLAYATLPVLSGAATYAIGKVFIQHFEAGGTFLTFDPAKVRDYFAQQFQEGKLVASKQKKQDTV